MPGPEAGLFAELKRRNVFRVAAMYAVVAWLVVQVADATFDALRLPEGSLRLLIIAVAAGFPVALILGWLFDWTSEGFVRTPEDPEHEVIRLRSRRRIDYAIIAVLVLALGMSLFGPEQEPTPAVHEPIRSIAVLPFDNLMGDPAEDYFVDGMTEALTAELAKIKALKVISRTTAMRYKETELAMPEIAAELDVVALIEGSVLREGDEVRVTAQLIHGPSDTHLWAESYTDTVTSVLRLQAEVALAIAHEIRAAITPEEESRIADARTVDPEAYREWLLGRHFRAMFSEDGFARAAEHLERAVAIDPGFAVAYADLAMSYWEPSTWGWADPRERLEPTRSAIEKALALDPDSSEAHAAAGHLAFSIYDWDSAERQLRHAIELNSDNPSAYKWLVWSLGTARRYDEAIAVGRRAVELDPLNPYAMDALADAYSAAGHFDRSISQRLQILELAPDHEGTLLDLGLDYLSAGRPEEALRTRQRLIELRGRDAPESLAVVYAYQGRTDEARDLLARLETDPSRTGAVWDMAPAYALVGEEERAIDWLEQAYERRAFGMVVLNMEWQKPLFRPLEGHPRYEALLERMAFPPDDD